MTAIALKNGAFCLGNKFSYGKANLATGASSAKQIVSTSIKNKSLFIMINNVRIARIFG